MRRLRIALFVKFIIIHGLAFGQVKANNELIAIPLITTYTPTNYEGGIQNWGITQDSLGFIYIANNYGLLEYDGASWTKYAVEGSTKLRSVLVESKTNHIYIGGQRQLGFYSHEPSGLIYNDLMPLIPAEVAVDEVWDLAQNDDEMYANINGTIISIKNNKTHVFNSISHAEFLNKLGEEIIVGANEGFYILNDEIGEFVLQRNSKRKNYRGIAKKDGGYILATYDGQLYHYENEQSKLVKTPIDDFLIKSKINKILKLANGNIVIGTQNNGLIIFDHSFNPVLHLTKNKGLNHRTVISLYEDEFNNLWVGLNNGICVVELGSPFSLINENVGLEGTGYSAVSYEDKAYLGTSSGMFKLDRDSPTPIAKNNYQLIKGTEGLVNNVSVLGNELVLSHHEGAFSIINERVNQFYDQTGTWMFKNTGTNNLIGGTYSGFVIRNKNSLQTTSLPGFQESSRVFEFINDSTLWMTHGYKGAYKIHFNEDTVKQVKHYGETDGFPSNILISVYEIDDELIFTASTGVYRYIKDADSFEPHPFLNKWFADRHVSKMRQAGDNSIYFIAGGGLGVLKRESIGIYEIQEKQFKKVNQFLSDDLENINIMDNNDVLIGAKEGFVLYRPAQDRPIKEDFNTYLKRVSVTDVNDSSSSISGVYFNNAELDKTKLVRFEFSAPYYDGLESIKYAYRLKPYENTWSDWTTTNWKEYTNLPANQYKLEIKALNIYEDESEITTYEFTIKPRWYESNIALATYSMLILFGFISVLYSREKKHKTEKLILNQSKEEVIKSKDREISEFSQKTNQQIQALKNENLKKEIDHKNSQLASVTMHLLSKNEFVMAIRKKLNDALESKDNKDDLQRIVKSIDKNMDEEEAWETFAHHFDQVHGNFLHKIKNEVNLTPQETKLCAYLKMNMSTKDIANLMNITVRGVELARYRLRKKLGIERDVNLTAYLENF